MGLFKHPRIEGLPLFPVLDGFTGLRIAQADLVTDLHTEFPLRRNAQSRVVLSVNQNDHLLSTSYSATNFV